jgi:methylglyoxal synthase
MTSYGERRPGGHGANGRLALVAHDGKKEELLAFVAEHRRVLARYALVSTDATGRLLAQRLALDIECVHSGPAGGDLQIAAQAIEGEITAVLFFRDPLACHAHQVDIEALLRICDVHAIPLATNPGTARLLLRALRPGLAAGGEHEDTHAVGAFPSPVAA